MVERDLGIAKDAPLTPVTQQIPRVFGALCQELGGKARNILFLGYHKITAFHAEGTEQLKQSRL